MRNGPLVHRSAHVSRFAYGTLAPLDRLASIAPFGQPHAFARRTGAAQSDLPDWKPRRIHLGSRLPINLRFFLAEQLGPLARVEDDAIVALAPRSMDILMRELARAIRRFSAQRAREAWIEVVIGLDRLEHQFFAASAQDRTRLVLCLRCACIGAGPLDLHCGGDCVAVDIGSAVHAEQKAASSVAPMPGAMHRAVEDFRAARAAADLPHYDLDCYVAGTQVIFTWRPLSAGGN